MAERRDLIVAASEPAARAYADEHGIADPYIATGAARLRGLRLSRFRLYLLPGIPPDMWSRLHALALMEGRRLSTYLADGCSIDALSNPDGTVTDRQGRVVGGWGSGGGVSGADA